MRALERLAVNGDGVGGEVGFGAEFGDDFAVEGDAAGKDDFLGFAAGGDAGGGEDFLEAVGHERRRIVESGTVEKWKNGTVKTQKTRYKVKSAE